MKPRSLVSSMELGTQRFRLHAEGQSHLSSREGSCAGTDENERRVWKETLFRFGPLTGLFALFLTLLSTTASIGILVGSSYSDIHKWTAPPSTYIAIFTAIGNLSIRYAAIQGVVVAWWRGALHGSDLQQLHLRWYAGTSVRGAIKSGRNMGWLGLACIFSTLVTIDGPLFQRASTVEELIYKDPITLNRSMVPQLPTGYTGGWANAKNFSDDFWTPSFNKTMPTPHGRTSNDIYLSVRPGVSLDIINSWYNDDGFPGIVKGCPGECTGKLVAPAVAATSCVSRTFATDYQEQWPGSDHDVHIPHAPPFRASLFVIATELLLDGQQEKINAITGFSKNTDCIGTFEYTICTLQSAVGEYDVTVRGNKTTLDSAANPEILSIAKNAPVEFDKYEYPPFHQSTLGGVAASMWIRWDSYFTMVNESTNVVFNSKGNAPYSSAVQTSGICPNFTNPRTEYMASMNKLMVYFGVAAAEGIRDSKTLDTLDPHFEINTTTTGYAHGTVNVYRTDYSYLLCALVLEALCVCLIAPTYWNFGKLGRSVSFSPLEIAKAFDAPILAGFNSQSSGRDIAEASKDRPVQYGAVLNGDKDGRFKLVFCDQSEVTRPGQGCSFDV